MKFNEVIRQSQIFFIVIINFLYFTTFFGEFDQPQAMHTMYEIFGRKLSAQSTIKWNEISFVNKIVVIY